MSDGPISREDAAEVLGVRPAASTDEVRAAYAPLFPELWSRYTNATNPEMEAKFASEIQVLRDAAEALAPGSTEDPYSDLPARERLGPTKIQINIASEARHIADKPSGAVP